MTAPKKRNRGRYAKGFLTPYEAEPEGTHTSRRAPHELGGYGVLLNDHITGPFFWYENAIKRPGIVVRWSDFVTRNTNHPAFRKLVLALPKPLHFPVNGFGRPVPPQYETPLATRQRDCAAV